MTSTHQTEFDQRYQSHLKHLKHLKLKGLQPKTIEAYSRAIRRMGEYFDQQIDALSGRPLAQQVLLQAVHHQLAALVVHGGLQRQHAGAAVRHQFADR